MYALEREVVVTVIGVAPTKVLFVGTLLTEPIPTLLVIIPALVPVNPPDKVSAPTTDPVA